MKRIVAIVFVLVFTVSFVGCKDQKPDGGDASPNPAETADNNSTYLYVSEKQPSGFDGEKLYVTVNGILMVYERYQPGIGDLTKKTVLGSFETETEIEGIVWEVYSTKEYPDLSYVLVISGTNASWTYRISEK